MSHTELWGKERQSATADFKQDDGAERQSGELDLSRRAQLNSMTPEEAAAHIAKLDAQRKKAEQQRLKGLVAELAEWFQQSLDLDPAIYADPGGYEKFFASLQTGLLLGSVLEKCTPKTLGLAYKFKPAQEGTFTARDNVCLFCESCLKLGVSTVDVFEVEDLIARKNDKAVVNCLLGLARVGYSKAGFKPPTIIQMEVEIDKEETTEDDGEEAEEPTQSGGYQPNKSDPIDVALAREMNELGLNLDIRRVGGKSGLYMVSGKKVHMRILRGQLLVRVGGGWTDLLSFSQKPSTARALEKQSSKKMLTLSTTSSIGDDGRAAHKESVEKKLVPLKTLVGGTEDSKSPKSVDTKDAKAVKDSGKAKDKSTKTSTTTTTTVTSPRVSRSPSPRPAKSAEASPKASPSPKAQASPKPTPTPTTTKPAKVVVAKDKYGNPIKPK